MLSASLLTLRGSSHGIAKRSGSTTPTLSNAVIRSLYRRLYKEAKRLDDDPMAKVLFPCSSNLQSILKVKGPLYVPDTTSYVDVLRQTFRETGTPGNIKLAFDTLMRLRAHDENIRTRLPEVMKDRQYLLEALTMEANEHKELFRAAALHPSPDRNLPYVAASGSLSVANRVELKVGTVLVAHPLSSTHVDRRVVLITERTPLETSAVVLDLQFMHPLSGGHPMFPEVFWGHDVYDGGFNQIGFTMPPTPQVVVLHTLEPQLEAAEAPVGPPDYRRWLSWREDKVRQDGVAASLRQHHEHLCKPVILGRLLESGVREPTLFLSGVEALPYLATLAPGQPRSSLRIYWGNMRWTTSQIEAEVAHGHWFPIAVSPSFFRPYDLTPPPSTEAAVQEPVALPEPRFPTVEEVEQSRRLRERRRGTNCVVPQVFSANQPLRRREVLWDEMMFALGGEYASLVGGSNPFNLQRGQRTPSSILAPVHLQSRRATSESSALPIGLVGSFDMVLGDDDEEEGELKAFPTEAVQHAAPSEAALMTQESSRSEDESVPESNDGSDDKKTE